jgi:ureidoglycolate lyase
VSEIELHAVPLTAERFAPYGDVIATSGGGIEAMNEARFDRFNDLAKVDVDTGGEGHVAISIVRSKTPTVLPYRFDMVERHPLGSQAFIPLSRFSFIVVVAPPGESVEAENLRAFVTNGTQAINYHRGTWHMPLIALHEGQEFLVVDRAPGEGNCEQRYLEEKLVLELR